MDNRQVKFTLILKPLYNKKPGSRATQEYRALLKEKCVISSLIYSLQLALLPLLLEEIFSKHHP